jgi:hypothetical protein
MVAKKKNSRQIKRVEARKTTKTEAPKSIKIKLELELPEVDTIAQGLLELPGKYTLELLNKLGRAKKAALVVLPKGKK